MEGIVFIIGVIGGVIVAFLLFKRKTIGTLRIDIMGQETEPYMFLEIDHGQSEQLVNGKLVTFQVKITQK